ncbi:hypothetical protein COCON_G00228880 [Conger conger]|uniref:Uncharacterized protein n=1 Tax=Conger conger TaxID=82655 RepID=A0A9Q1CVF4_CONCO|nr:hypothetical protein COCON_G00228880 [Conger conger]
MAVQPEHRDATRMRGAVGTLGILPQHHRARHAETLVHGLPISEHCLCLRHRSHMIRENVENWKTDNLKIPPKVSSCIYLQTVFRPGGGSPAQPSPAKPSPAQLSSAQPSPALCPGGRPVPPGRCGAAQAGSCSCLSTLSCPIAETVPRRGGVDPERSAHRSAFLRLGTAMWHSQSGESPCHRDVAAVSGERIWMLVSVEMKTEAVSRLPGCRARLSVVFTHGGKRNHGSRTDKGS